MSIETAPPGADEAKLAFVDGRDALAYLIIRPAEGGVELEASANGIGKPDAARILRHVADQWDPNPALIELTEELFSAFREDLVDGLDAAMGACHHEEVSSEWDLCNACAADAAVKVLRELTAQPRPEPQASKEIN